VTMLALLAAGARPVARQPLLPPPPPEDADDETKRQCVSGAVTGLCAYLALIALACVDGCGVHTPTACAAVTRGCVVHCVAALTHIELTSHVSLH
jgi:hypothetical protein